MPVRAWVAVAALVLIAAAATAHAQVRSTTIEYSSGSSATGYDTASFGATYALHACDGSVVITTAFVRGTFRWSRTYWLDGKSYPAPGGLSPTVDDQGDFNGTVRVRGGGVIGSFQTIAGPHAAHGCLGDTTRVVGLAAFVDAKDKRAVETFITTLEVIPATNPAYRNRDIENAIRHQLEEDQREGKRKEDEAKRKAQDEEKRKAQEAESRRKDEERKRKEDEERQAQDERKRNEDEKRKAQDEATAKGDEARKDKDEEARQAEEDARKVKEEDAATQQAQDARKAERAAAGASKAKREEAAQKAVGAEDERASANTKWSSADEADHGDAYWPESRCAWVDSRGFIHPPYGRHRCDPEFMKRLFVTIRKQTAAESARLQHEREQQAKRDYIEQASEGSADSAAMLGAAAAAAPLVEAAGDAANHLNDKFPRTFDLEATARILFTGETGYGLGLRAPGIFYVHMGFDSYDSGESNHVQAYSFGLGAQLPITRAFTIRVVELGGSLGGITHPGKATTFTAGFSARTGVVYRLVSGLSFSAGVGIDTIAGLNAFFSDFGVLWRFDLSSNRRYMVR